MSMVWKMLGAAQADPPTHAVAVFDAPGKNFRHKLFPAYKANREPARRIEIDEQLPMIRHAAETLGLARMECAGFEADDVVATLAHLAVRAGKRVTIVSSDKDFGQMVVDDSIEIVDPMAKRRMLAADIERKMGVPPALVADVQALAGDAIDGIPGIPGLGMERAAALVRRFGSLAEVLRHTDECRWPQVRSQLKRHAADARLYLKLTTLRRNVPLKVNWDELRAQPAVRSHLVAICKALEASAHFEAIFHLDCAAPRSVPRVADPMAWWKEELLASRQPVPDEPQCGFYQRRLARRCPFVPARIWRERAADPVTGKPLDRDMLRCEVAGKPRDPFSEWQWLFGNPITEATYKFEIADGEWLKVYQPDHPKAHPDKPVDILKMPARHNPHQRRGTTS
jgi:DNA polymerase-1